jgi:uncharacterized phosphosugar-binding protein
VDGEERYFVTERGRCVARELKSEFLPGILDRALAAAQRYLNFKERGIVPHCAVEKTEDGRFSVTCSFTEKKDLIFIFSASGKNQVPVEMGDAAQAAGIPSVGVSSSAYFDCGGRLHEHVDVAIDCKVPYGDACIAVGDAKMGGLSTAAACFILNTCLIDGAKLALERGVTPPIYLSGNVEGGREHNVKLENLYLGRVKHL